MVGKQYTILIANYQQFLGSTTPFFQDDPTKYSYRPKSSLITFVWEELYVMAGTLTSHSWWLFTTTYHSDPSIMTTILAAQLRSQNTPHTISDKTVRNANLVHLYLRVTFLSKILTDDMTELAQWALLAMDRCCVLYFVWSSVALF